jgi:hypothetical protein
MNIQELHEGNYAPPLPPHDPNDLDQFERPPMIRQVNIIEGRQNLYYFDANNSLQLVPDLVLYLEIPDFNSVSVIERINIEPGYKIVWYRSNNDNNPITINHDRNICIAGREFTHFSLSRRVVVNDQDGLLIPHNLEKKYLKYKNKYLKLKK